MLMLSLQTQSALIITWTLPDLALALLDEIPQSINFTVITTRVGSGNENMSVIPYTPTQSVQGFSLVGLEADTPHTIRVKATYSDPALISDIVQQNGSTLNMGKSVGSVCSV